jgi:hypothetical protein
VCITAPETKTYWVGLGADNNFRIVVDGSDIVNTLNGPYDGAFDSNSNISFIYWHVYPITISAGNHVIELYGLNRDPGTIAGFGCEIYNNTIDELTGATTVSDLNILFSSSGQTSATTIQDLSGNYLSSGFTCPTGYIYDPCNSNCYTIINPCQPGPLPSVTPTKTQTPTKTPTNTRTVNVFTGFSQCDQNIYVNSNQTGLYEYTIDLGSSVGTVQLNFNSYSVPDSYQIVWSGSTVVDTGFRGSSVYDPQLNSLGYPNVSGPGSGSISFNKTSASPANATLIVNSPIDASLWSATVNCPKPFTTPSPTPTKSVTPTKTPTPTPTPTSTPPLPPLSIIYTLTDPDNLKLKGVIIK